MGAVKVPFTCPFTGKTWSASERNAAETAKNKAEKKGDYLRPKKCNRCGAEPKYIETHHHSYDHPTQHVEALCKSCHGRLHNRYKSQTGPDNLDRQMWEKFMAVKAST
jgi:hypothetical protein